MLQLSYFIPAACLITVKHALLFLSNKTSGRFSDTYARFKNYLYREPMPLVRIKTAKKSRRTAPIRQR